MAESKEPLKEGERGKWKIWLKPIWSQHLRQIEEEKAAGTDFIFLGSKITADSDYSQEIQRRFLLGEKL